MTGSPRVSARFNGRVGTFALELAFSAADQGVTALFGPSGCGKTTTLRCMAGLTRLPGELRVDGAVWQDEAEGIFLEPHLRQVGYVFQEASLFPHISVARNLAFGERRARRDGNPEVVRRDDVIELLALSPLLNRMPGRLSGGERQRVALGRALLAKPRLLLMDEPLAALDRASREEILPYIGALGDAAGIPIVYVSHDLSEIARLARRIVVMSAGRLVAEGPLDEMLERLDLGPATGRFEAGVVLTATVRTHDAELRMTRLDHHGQTLSVPWIDAPAGEQVRLRVRARDVALSTAYPESISIRNVLRGEIVELAAEPDTAFAETLVDVGGGRVRARITREAVADLNLSRGAQVYVLIKSISFDSRSVISATPE